MNADFTLLIPEFILAGAGFLVLLVDLLLPREQEHRRNAFTSATAVLGLAVTGVVAATTQMNTGESFHDGLLFIDRYSLLFKVLFVGIGIAVVVMSVDYVAEKMSHPGEYYALIIFAVLGATLMAESGELLTAFISIELLSFSLYVLVGLSRGDARTAEASTKYILLGAISTAIMLYGISQLFGVMGTTRFTEMGGLLAAAGDWDMTLISGFVMVLAGLGFKLSMAPFHMWAPDVYEGAPTPITALIATLSKAAAIALLLRFLAEVGSGAVHEWRMPLAVLAAATMVIGSLSALPQTNIKRLLAYSSIAQIGFVLVGIVPNTVIGANAVLLHVIGYAFTNLAAFTVVIIIELKLGKETIADFAGLSKRAPVLAMIMTGALFSLAGLPIFAGFLTKFYLFTSAVDKSLEWLVVVAVATSVISLYYYIRIVREMYITETEDESKLPVPALVGLLAWVLFAGTIAVGIYPAPFVDATNAAVTVLTPWVAL